MDNDIFEPLYFLFTILILAILMHRVVETKEMVENIEQNCCQCIQIKDE